MGLEQLLRAGESFSGRERNCAFLNTGDGRFTDVSGALGWDFPDDGRAIGLTDWDTDGDVDLWVRNRNSPGLRFLRNETPRAGSFAAFTLRGTRANRDAIGARVTVSLAGAPPRRLVRGLRAGEGFRGQSGKTLWFGLGPPAEIAEVSVRWPDGATERFTGVEPDATWLLVEGDGAARRVAPPRRRLRIAAGDQPVPPASGTVRVVAASRPPLPRLPYQRLDGGPAEVVPPATGALLVNLWATWCLPCAAELREAAERASDLRAAGLDVLALSVDALSADTAKPAGDPRAFLERVGFGGPSGRATRELLTKAEIVVQELLDSRRPLPVPASLLVSSDGTVAAAYLGRVTVDDLIADARRSAQERFQSATPFGGRWHRVPFRPSLKAMAHRLREAGFAEDAGALDAAQAMRLAEFRNGVAVELMRRGEHAEAASRLAALLADAPDFAPARVNLGRCLLEMGRPADAERELRRALVAEPGLLRARVGLATAGIQLGRVDLGLRELDAILTEHPADGEAREARGLALAVLGRRAEAVTDLTQALREGRDGGALRYQLGLSLRATGRGREALPHLREAARLVPTSPAVTSSVAWILATDADAALRDGAAAVALAEHLCRLSGAENPLALDVLAAAQAEAGRFGDAVATQARAVALATSSQARSLPDLQARLRLYESRKPYREGASRT
jgi:tetratricopeptide (TPR) repeat protein